METAQLSQFQQFPPAPTAVINVIFQSQNLKNQILQMFLFQPLLRNTTSELELDYLIWI